MKRKDLLIGIPAFILIMGLTIFITVMPVRNKEVEALTHETVPETETVTETEPVTEPVTESEDETATEPVFTPYDHIPLSDELQTDIYNRCNKYGIDYNLTLAVIKTESSFKTDAIGDSGNAIGLCQIWTYWWGDLAEERGLNLYEPADNVELMLIILSSHLDTCEGNLTEALQMYNTGTPEGTVYADRVYKNLNLIESEVNSYGY